MILALPLIGLLTLLGQVCLLRELNVAFYGSELVYLLALGIWLLWTAVGAMLGRRTFVPTARHVRWLLLAFAISLPTSLVFVRGIRPLWAVVPGAYLSFPQQMASMAGALLFLGVLAGLLFQWAAKLYLHERPSTLARAYALESAGGVVGGLVATLLLKWGAQNLSVMLMGATAAALTALLIPPRRRAGLEVTALVLAALWIAGLAGSERFDRQLTRWTHPQLRDTQDTPYGRVTVTEHEDRLAVFENDALAFETQGISAEIFVHPIVLQHPDPQRVLVLGGAVEGLVGEVVLHKPWHVDDVELDRVLLDRVIPLLPAGIQGPLQRDPVELHVTDPRAFLERASAYDVILIGMPEPHSGAANRFYTREFFARCRVRLDEGGVVGLRLRTSENFWTPQQTGRLTSIVAALSSVFEDVLVLPGAHTLILASTHPLERDPAVLTQRLEQRGVRARLVSGPYLRYLYTNDRVQQAETILATSKAVPNTDARPVCYAYTQMLWLANFFPALANVDPLAPSRWLRGHALWTWLAWPGLVMVFAGLRRRTRLRRLALAATAGMAGMVLENLLILHYQTKSGVLYQNLGLLLMMFMAGLALGALVIDRLARRRSRAEESSARGDGLPRWVGLACVLGFAAQSAFLAWRFQAGSVGDLVSVAFHLLLAGCLVSGTFAYSSLWRVPDQGSVVSPLYAADLMGGCVGSLVASLFLAPVLGLAIGAWAMGLLALAAVLLL